jgi:hypothetical protein
MVGSSGRGSVQGSKADEEMGFLDWHLRAAYWRGEPTPVGITRHEWLSKQWMVMAVVVSVHHPVLLQSSNVLELAAAAFD